MPHLRYVAFRLHDDITTRDNNKNGPAHPEPGPPGGIENPKRWGGSGLAPWAVAAVSDEPGF